MPHTMQAAHHICAPLLTIAQQYVDRAVFIDEDTGLPGPSSIRSATGLQLLHRVALLSRALSTCLSVAAGSVIVIVSQTSGAMMESLLAALDAGCIVCPVNWRWTAKELAEALERLSPAAIMYDSFCAALTQEAFAAAYVRKVAGNAMSTPSAPALCHIDHWQSPSCQFQQPWPLHTHPSSCYHSSTIAYSSNHLLPQPHLNPTASPPPTTTTTALLLASSTPLPPVPPPLQLLTPPCCTALLVFTSGTTAAPKGVQLSHAAFHAQSLVKLALVGYSHADTYLHLAPLFHIGGLSSAFAALTAGAVHVFMRRFDPAAALGAIVRHRVTAFIAVPTMLQDLAAAAAEAAVAEVVAEAGGSVTGVTAAAGAKEGLRLSAGCLDCVSKILVGAGGTSHVLQEAVARTFPRADLTSAYGMTEACSSMTFAHLRRAGSSSAASTATATAASAASAAPTSASLPGQHPSTAQLGRRPVCFAPPGAVFVGWPAPGVQIRIGRSTPGDASDAPAASARERSSAAGEEKDGEGVATGLRSMGGGVEGCRDVSYEVGEVQTRGPHVMLGYWRDTQATAEALLPGGWLRTGDLGWLAGEGGLWLMGRAKDVIKSGGENVFAPQVETVLLSHPAVAAAAVVGLPEERLGEQVSALLVLRDGWDFDGPLLLLPPHAHPPPHPVASSCNDRSSVIGNSSNCSSTVNNADSSSAQHSHPQHPHPQPPQPQPQPQSPHCCRRTSLADLQSHCRAQGLAGFRLPRFAAAQRGPLPVNGSGKVQKPVVRELLAVARAQWEQGQVRQRQVRQQGREQQQQEQSGMEGDAGLRSGEEGLGGAVRSRL
ncbi:hypothetical protein Agub_g368 [Astrephomene gubernaculifera]|uniref:Uncharacterized protein n=1 Tax=Astrephomene gubernaculifera TaxID=47775 RepID=A0AAD3DDX5_9CHLO|nr:hypothetical protein Agub_g368 [Astrephomene gubernaculifera]